MNGVMLMIKDAKLLSRFEQEEIRKKPPDYGAALRIFEGMWLEGKKNGFIQFESSDQEMHS